MKRKQKNFLLGQQILVIVSHIGTCPTFIIIKGGDLKKAKFYCKAAAMAGHERARCQLGNWEAEAGNMEQAVKHWTIAASCGCYRSMQELRLWFGIGVVSRESIDSNLKAYNNSCVEMSSEARDTFIRLYIDYL